MKGLLLSGSNPFLSLLTNRREQQRFLRFAVVGVIGAVVDFGSANLLIGLWRTPLVLAGTISFLLAILSNFTWNRFWTTPTRARNRLPSNWCNS